MCILRACKLRAGYSRSRDHISSRFNLLWSRPVSNQKEMFSVPGPAQLS